MPLSLTQSEALRRFLAEHSMTREDALLDLAVHLADEDEAAAALEEQKRQKEARRSVLLGRCFRYNSTYYKVISTKGLSDNAVSCLVILNAAEYIFDGDEITLETGLQVWQNVTMDYLENTFADEVEEVKASEFLEHLRSKADEIFYKEPDETISY